MKHRPLRRVERSLDELDDGRNDIVDEEPIGVTVVATASFRHRLVKLVDSKQSPEPGMLAQLRAQTTGEEPSAHPAQLAQVPSLIRQ